MKENLSIRNHAFDIGLEDSLIATPVFNDNRSCCDWSKTTTTKGLTYHNLRENFIRECQQLDKSILVQHIPGKDNCSDIFTKELRNASHFRTLRDSIISSRASFLLLQSHAHSRPKSSTTSYLSPPDTNDCHITPTARRTTFHHQSPLLPLRPDQWPSRETPMPPSDCHVSSSSTSGDTVHRFLSSTALQSLTPEPSSSTLEWGVLDLCSRYNIGTVSGTEI